MSCQSVPPVRPGVSTPPPATSEDIAQKAEAAGDYLRASQAYEQLAQNTAPPQRQDFQIKSIAALIQGAQIGKAQELIAKLDVSGLNPSFLGRKQILQAQIAAAEQKPNDAINLLNQAERIHLDPTLLAEIYQARAQIEVGQGHPINALMDLIGREKYIVNTPDIAANQQQLWNIMLGLSPTVLASNLNSTKDPVLAGWLDLALIVQQHPPGSEELTGAIEQWKKAHPNHPAITAFVATLTKPAPGQIGPITQLALLLPLTSEYAQAAQAVRDGFFAMDMANKDPNKPKIIVYDIGRDPAQAANYYAAAVAEGAQFIVGPLGLEATNQVVKNAKLSVPTLLLSSSEITIKSDVPIIQFGLPPEEEAAQAAERAYLDGHRQAAVLYPNTAWGQRMFNAFSNEWQQLGGALNSAKPYQLEENDYSDTVKQLLNVTQSEARAHALENVLHIKLSFESRIRQDIDFVFLAADPKHGRLIKPQLNYYHAAHLPVYSTSYIFAGDNDAINDTDLDGVMFGDMPWMLVGNGKIANLRQTVQGAWPFAHTNLDRLYALGMDSYAIIPQLNRLNLENSARFTGVTGTLNLHNGRLQRHLLWDKFRKGVPQLLDTFYNYTNQFQIEDEANAVTGTSH